jgi:hypothetical protein
VLSTAITGTTTPSATLPARRDFPLKRLYAPAAPSTARHRGQRGLPQFTCPPSDHPDPPTPEGSSTPAPGTRTSSVAFAVISAARHPLVPPCGGLASRGCRIRFMLRAGRLLPPQGLSTPRFDAGRFPPTPAACYQAPWRLPGPDFHRLADTRLCAGQLISTPPFIDKCPRRWAHEIQVRSMSQRASRSARS